MASEAVIASILVSGHWIFLVRGIHDAAGEARGFRRLATGATLAYTGAMNASRSALSLLPLLSLLALQGCSAPADGGAEQADEAYTLAKVLFADKIPTSTAKYPIVLEHGFAASAEASSIWKFDGVVADLTAAGHVLVVADEVEPFSSAKARAATMEKTLRNVKAQCEALAGCDATGVHVIAHSFGGLHSREYIRQHPPSMAASEGLPRVVSLTTVSTPNRGTAIADLGLSIITAFKEHPSLEAIAEADVNKLAGLIGRTFTKEELVEDPHIEDALHDLSEANAESFAATHPADPDVAYFAWAGVSENPNPILHPFHPERITRAMPADCGGLAYSFQDRAFATDIILGAAHDVSGHFLSHEPNDGMATVASAKGLPGAKFLGCIPADHLAEVGHGTAAKKTWTGYDHKTFFRYVAGGLARIEQH